MGERVPLRHGQRPCCTLLWYREHRGTWHNDTACAGALHGWRGNSVKVVGGLLRPQKVLGGIDSVFKPGHSCW